MNKPKKPVHKPNFHDFYGMSDAVSKKVLKLIEYADRLGLEVEYSLIIRPKKNGSKND